MFRCHPDDDTNLRMSPLLIVVVLSLLLGLQPLTTDLYLPALPALTQAFEATMGQAQLTLTALLLAFGVSQLFWGPLSDRVGRRPVLLMGLCAYVAASLGCATADSMTTLIAWRSLQGVAMGACVMCARAIVRDLYAPNEGARVMSKGLSGLGVLACISAPLGGLLSDLLGWRFALGSLALFGIFTLGLIASRFKESLRDKNPKALQPLELWSTWRLILGDPTFWAFSALATASYAGLFTFLASSSFVFIQVLGYGKTQYGLLMFSMSLSYILGTFWCRRMLPRWGVQRAVALAGVLTLTGGTLMGLLAWFGHTSQWYGGWAIMLPFYLFMLGHGVHQPCGQSGATGPFPQAAGAASAWNGFLMMIAAFGMGAWLGRYMDGTVLPLALGVWFWSVVITLVAWTLVQRYGHSQHA